MLRTSNPALSDKRFQVAAISEEKMTLEGTVNKSFVLIGLVVLFAFFSWSQAVSVGDDGFSKVAIPNWYLPSILVAFLVALTLMFKQSWAPFLAPVYAVFEGLVLGALSAWFELQYPGIVFQAVLCTCGTFTALLLAYKSRLIKATENFKLGVVAATCGIALVYLAEFVLSFFGHRIPLIHETGIRGILFSAVVTVIAALNLVLDFDFIEKGAERGSPKYMEWYSAFGLLVNLVWLYVEFLRLLSKTRKR